MDFASEEEHAEWQAQARSALLEARGEVDFEALRQAWENQAGGLSRAILFDLGTYDPATKLPLHLQATLSERMAADLDRQFEEGQKPLERIGRAFRWALGPEIAIEMAIMTFQRIGAVCAKHNFSEEPKTLPEVAEYARRYKDVIMS